MNLMGEFQSKNKSATVKKILENKESQKIKMVDLDKYTMKNTDSYYFLDCVPYIPSNFEVTYKWSEYLPMCINWNKDEKVDISALKKQYGFVALVESTEKNKSTNRKDSFSCHMVFNSFTNCAKHLSWFNSCFPVEEPVVESKKVVKKKPKKKK